MLSDRYINSVANGGGWQVSSSSAERMANEIMRHRAALEKMKRMIRDLEGDPHVEEMLRELIALHEEA